ncbi:uncharacterized protein [Nicotiana sylvestris]|uniref:uncharacterized protein n=1 Tax=Nicotiana sylvestris TaxID=4096 RepID=UPI00388C34C9
MVQGSKQWHEVFPFALLGYRSTVCTSVGATPYLLVYGTKVVIPAEVEIPSLRIVAEAEIDEEDEWVKTRLEQLSLIDEKRHSPGEQGRTTRVLRIESNVQRKTAIRSPPKELREAAIFKVK